MTDAQRHPFYLWIILLVCIVTIFMGERLIPGAASQMIWLIMLLPSFAFAYEFRFKGGLAFSFVVLISEGLIKWYDFIKGDLRAIPLYQFLSFFVVLLAFSISISALVHRLHIKRDKLKELINHDSLTGFYNRAAIRQELERFAESSHSSEVIISCLFIDIDDFKFVNETYGHDTGDRCLKEIALQIKALVPLKEKPHFARLGSDEFVIVLPDTGKVQAELLALDIQSKLSNSHYLQKLNMTFSIGVASFPEDCQSVTEILQESDIAMYQAKRDGKNRVCTYSSDSKLTLLDDLQMEQDLRVAWNNKEFRLAFQPQVAVASGEIVGLETLLRWHHPARGIVPPDKFIPVLERTGLIVPLGQWVLQEACRMCKGWQQAFSSNLRIAVNVSPVQLQDSQFVCSVREALHAAELSADSLELEITENIAMIYSDICIRKMQELKTIGIRFAMDDFGSGYSSLNYLTRYPIDVVKLDKGFVQALNESPSHTILMQSLIELAHRLHMEVVAEGVEHREQLDFCELHACDTVQGYYTGRPIPGEAVDLYLRNFSYEKLAN
ncbi:putative bifunctional diguanylate cyclase/phosphodiesterase [Paenibacillus oryzisoli]|uniref:Diguanylate cyclase n=1 Tax=Paenibacillus oryzisoli TaxID=1850517 RepID=A0A198AR89_9BACL|nr:GGDEF domain-containing phosphodiesterase [Paenibacillus oryzisoli]OAS23610.1 hypothetical protein A8708_31710 [Paenibacillus oryzisoli]